MQKLTWICLNQTLQLEVGAWRVVRRHGDSTEAGGGIGGKIGARKKGDKHSSSAESSRHHTLPPSRIIIFLFFPYGPIHCSKAYAKPHWKCDFAILNVNKSFGVRRTVHKSWLYHLLAMWPWTNYLISELEFPRLSHGWNGSSNAHNITLRIEWHNMGTYEMR